MDTKKYVELDEQGIKIGNEYKILLCSSLFYFRIPKAEWEDRIRKIKMAGYNCLDVYFPWNYHEEEEGKWNFEGEKNVEGFLEIVKKYKMYVIARPGPYICSEWDLGGLPAYLLTKEGIRLRDENAVYLSYVEKWFDKIMPIIHKYQLTEEGTIIAVQIENELDFYNCKNRKGYMKSLLELTKKYNIEVPIVACAGQGDIEGATGLVEGIVPTFNFYPSIKDPSIEAKIYYYLDYVRRKNLPLLITETGREHFLLKRLLASGAKLIGAYNQVGGTNFEFYNAVNNWGEPLSLIACDYDFNSLISAFGEINEKEFVEARVLSKIINSLGELIAASSIEINNSVEVEIEKGELCPITRIINLNGYGKMASLVNVADGDAVVKIKMKNDLLPYESELSVRPLACRYVFLDLDLKKWGINGKILFSSAEPCFIDAISDETVMVFYTPDEKSEITLVIEEIEKIEGDVDVSNVVTFRFKKEESGRSITIVLKNGKKLKLIGLDKISAAKLEGIDENGNLIYLENFENQAIVAGENLRSVRVTFENRLNELLYAQKVAENHKPVFLEQAGIERGWGWYDLKFNTTNTDEFKGIVIDNASDILSMFVDKHFLGTFINGGDYLYIDSPLKVEGKEIEIFIKSEIWGHCNFDDIRKKSLRLHSLKGLSDVSLIKDVIDITQNWYLYKDTNFDHPPIYTNFGSRLNSNKGFKDCYYKEIFVDENTETLYLWFKNFQCRGVLYINDKCVGEIDKYYQFFNVTEYIKKGSINNIKVIVEKNYYDETAGKVYMLKGIKSRECTISGLSAHNLYKLSIDAKERSNELALPLVLGEDNSAIVYIEPSYKDAYKKIKAIFKGENIKITAITQNKVIGRIWTDEMINKSFLRGGKPDVLYIPKERLDENNSNFILYLEKIRKGQKGILHAIELKFMR
ncbi:glycoside hydrolase family 35 [Caldicellulosiruptor hydrothermalis 108]|uniref:Glycoside hydrolase family 35 n=1 Tax=Caldicellulosiruptor hydrothermalis (strain DSM 18901 / VKM B-2411 / 108) TaxID=632292 RepID=E4QDB3_CALH1|nr:beta-galactosidase [Caldicellulosiruptor hydrothermalis]ADQ06408.1 glycoside hydrolase family 35 [Caldicellulosiruptor hydrothermalis 108]